MPSCRQCSQAFDITPDDLAFYEKVSPVFNGKKELIPPPTLCPPCREQRRMAWRNERNLYHRKSDLSGKQIVSLYSPDKPFLIYAQDEWWGDQWDQHASAMTFDFHRTFLEQFVDLQRRAPRLPLLSKQSENSEFTNHAADNKNCYLSFIVFTSEDVLYSRKVFQSKDIVDSYYVSQNSERLYECFWAQRCYQCSYLQNCSDLHDCHFCIDCRGCSDCFLSSNLRNKKFVFMNRQRTEDEYRDLIKKAMDGKYTTQLQLLSAFDDVKRSTIYPHLMIQNSEGCSGDYLANCKNVIASYYSIKGEDLRYCMECDPARNQGVAYHCADVFGFGSCEHVYEIQAQANGAYNIVNNFSYDVKNCLYVDNCHNCQHCFGCIGLQQKQYCILNTQYSKEEYEQLVPRMIEKMRTDGEWGEFFPIALSPFGYNETVAQEYYPLTKEEVLKRGWKWHEEAELQNQYMGPAYSIADSIHDVPDDITKQILRCEVSGKPYKIIPQELKFYRDMSIPIPRKCPEQRHKERMAIRNPRKLWKRACANCQKDIQTTYAPERPEIVYCERCYLETVY